MTDQADGFHYATPDAADLCDRCESAPSVGLCLGCLGQFCAACQPIHKHRGEFDTNDETFVRHTFDQPTAADHG